MTFEEMLDDWLPLTYALNAVNRSMGRDDLYPFTLAPPVIEKLDFVHDACGREPRHRQRGAGGGVTGAAPTA